MDLGSYIIVRPLYTPYQLLRFKLAGILRTDIILTSYLTLYVSLVHFLKIAKYFVQAETNSLRPHHFQNINKYHFYSLFFCKTLSLIRKWDLISKWSNKIIYFFTETLVTMMLCSIIYIRTNKKQKKTPTYSNRVVHFSFSYVQ